MKQLIDREEVLEIVREWSCIVERHVGKNACTDLYEDIEAIPTHKAESEWVSVEERLPNDMGELFMLAMKGGWVYDDLVKWDSNLNVFYNVNGTEWTDSDITHWRPLPQPPKVEK